MRALVATCLVALACSSTPPRTEQTPGTGGPLVVTPLDAATADATAVATPPPPPGCMRQRTTFQYRCSGVPPGPGEPNGYEVAVCDLCLADADCAAKPGGKCLEVGDSMCSEPRHLTCKYPDPACGGRICPEPVPVYPPSAPPSAQ